jgi:hypothetical protein
MSFWNQSIRRDTCSSEFSDSVCWVSVTLGAALIGPSVGVRSPVSAYRAISSVSTLYGKSVSQSTALSKKLRLDLRYTDWSDGVKRAMLEIKMGPKLSILQELNGLVLEKSDRAPLPGKAETLYVEPMASGERRNCRNCCMWVKDSRCMIHEPSLHISGDYVCGYHSPGEPLDRNPLKITDVVSPNLSGLTLVVGGTACNNCRYASAGHCMAMEEDGKHPPISPLGCCSRWEKTKA